MESEALPHLPGLAVPDDGGLVDTAAEEEVSSFTPFQREDGALMPRARYLQGPLGGIAIAVKTCLPDPAGCTVEPGNKDSEG